MTLFAESAAETPSWMLAHHPLSVPDVLVSTKDRAVRKRWMEEAQQERDETMRLFTLEDRPMDGPVLWRAHRQTTPASAWAWFHQITTAPGHRLVLIDTTKGEK